MNPKKPAYETLEKMIAKLEDELADRRGIERELAHMASFADMAPTPIVEINPDGSIGYLNPAAEQEFPNLRKEGKAHALMAGLPSIVELLMLEKKDLMTRTIKIGPKVYDQQISLLNGGPRIRLYLSDITELKRLDQLKSDFVNMVSHELRTPLTTIGASMKMIAAGFLGAITPDQLGVLKLADINIDRLSRMINDLLDVSKIEAGKLEIRRAQVDLAEMVREVCRTFEPLARDRGLQIHAELGQDPIVALIDRDKILQVFTNLVNNALKFTEKGHVSVSATMADREIRCRVADTGPGIDPADLPNVFGKFSQFGSTPRGREKGTGLGLSLCKGLVELHRGRIWVESRPREGSQFIFVLPQRNMEEVFGEKVRVIFSESVAAGNPLSLARLSIPGWKGIRQARGDGGTPERMNRFQDLVMKTVRAESDQLFQNEESILLILPGVDQAKALQIMTRLRKAWHESPLAKTAGATLELDVRIGAYPEDGNLPEQLLARL